MELKESLDAQPPHGALKIRFPHRRRDMASFEFLGLAVHMIWFTTIASHFVTQVAQNQNHQLKTPFERCWDFQWCCGRNANLVQNLKIFSWDGLESLNLTQVLLGELGLRRIPGWVRIQEKHTGKIGKPPVGLPGKLRWIELLGLLAKLIMWWRQWGEIYSKLYGNAGEKIRRWERFDSKRMILEFLGVIICFLIAFVFMSVRLSAHALYSWNRRSISADEVSLRSFPAAFIPFVSMCLVCDHFLQVSTQAEETLQTLRCEMSSDFPLHNEKSLRSFSFTPCFFFPTKLGHPIFLLRT